jgi:hypothetical protein
MHKMCGLDTLLLFPPIDDERNVIDASLQGGFARGWVGQFFKRGNTPIRYTVTAPPYQCTSRSTSNVYFTFTFSQTMGFPSDN